MKAFLLAAGMGSRLKPITDTIPKCLVPIAGHSMLDWWAKLFIEAGVSEVLINTHYLHEQVHDYIERFNAENTKLQWTEAYEETLRGSGGTVRDRWDFVKDEEDFLICYADNLTDMNLKKMISYHLDTKARFTMGLFHTGVPKQCGIVSLDENGIVTEFVEKPENPKSDLANAGVYIANRSIRELLTDKEVLDFGKDVLPALVGQMHGYPISSYFIDIGTMENYHKAQEDWKYDYYKDAFSC
ncbi:MAG: nucleotidyltransferase family protein [Lachnospiraceae bacterium]|nr:nucleotidyltransferase family protein [Lachnospiraceae bacterium]